MATPEDIVDAVLSFSEAEYFIADEAPIKARQIDLLDQAFHGLAINAPPMIAAGAATIPLVLAIRETGHHAWQVSRDANTCLVAIDLDRRELFTAPAFVDTKLIEYPPERHASSPEPTGPDADSISSGLYRLDARAVLDLPDHAARYRFAVIARDWVSNLVEVRVAGDEAPPPEPREPSPAPAERDAEEPRTPTYLQGREQSEEVSNPFDDAGEQTEAQLRLPVLEATVSPNVERGLAVGLAGRCVVAGDPALLAPAGQATTEGPVAALIPMTVLLFTDDQPRPARADLVVPCHGPAASPGEPLTAFFELDLAAAARPAAPSVDHLAYIALEGTLVGPIPVEVSPS